MFVGSSERFSLIEPRAANDIVSALRALAGTVRDGV